MEETVATVCVAVSRAEIMKMIQRQRKSEIDRGGRQ
jgi:hypothetical protein